MKKSTLLLIVILQSVLTTAQRFEWLSRSRQYNSNQGIPVATDAVGNVYTLIDVVMGEEVYQAEASNGNKRDCKVQLQTASGVYFVRIENDEKKTYTSKLIVE